MMTDAGARAEAEARRSQAACGRGADILLFTRPGHRIPYPPGLSCAPVRRDNGRQAEADGLAATRGPGESIGSPGRPQPLSARAAVGHADLCGRLRQVVDLVLAVSGQNVSIAQTSDAGCRVADAAVAPVLQIVLEAMTEVIRRAAGQRGEIGLSLECLRRGESVLVRVCDNGPVILESLAPSGAGFRKMEALAEKAGASFSYLSCGGFMLQLELPAAS